MVRETAGRDRVPICGDDHGAARLGFVAAIAEPGTAARER